MSIDYIRKTYGVNFKIGDPVRIRVGCGSWFDGQPGKLISARGQYLFVRGETWRGNFHPSDVQPISGDSSACSVVTASQPARVIA